MSDEYRILEVRRESLPAGREGVRVRARLTGCPSRRWSHGMTARLPGGLGEMADHPRPKPVVQGDEIVLEGVDAGEAQALAGALIWAVDAANRAPRAEPSDTAAVPPPWPGADADSRAPLRQPVPAGGWSAIGGGDRPEPSRWFG